MFAKFRLDFLSARILARNITRNPGRNLTTLSGTTPVSSRCTRNNNTLQKLRQIQHNQRRGVRYLGREWTWIELWKLEWRTQPVRLSLLLAGTTGLIIALIQVIIGRRRIDKNLGSYPKAVGEKLQTAIYYSRVIPDLEKAITYYAQALQAAAEEGLDPLGDEVIGIKTECAACLEVNGNARAAVELLEEVKTGCLSWIEQHGEELDGAPRRSKLLAWACRISTRLADLYSSKYIGDEQKMEESLVWAVETTLQEKQRREKEGVKEGEPPWLDDDELGTQLEDLGHAYLKKDKQYFASQLFLNALMIKPEKDCHAVTLMNNVAATMAENSPPIEPGTPPPSRAQQRESGRAWARHALELARKIQPPVRNEECDLGCVAATHNLGRFAEMDGNITEARQRFVEAGSIATAIGYEEGINEANEGLKRLGASQQSFKPRKWW